MTMNNSKLWQIAAIERNDSQLPNCHSEYQFFVKHLMRENCYNSICSSVLKKFNECQDCDHCSTTPVQTVNFFHFLKQHDGIVPTPQSSSVHEGHYSSLLHHAKQTNCFLLQRKSAQFEGLKPCVL